MLAPGFAVDPSTIKDPALRAVYSAQVEILARAKRDSDIRLVTTGLAIVGGIVAFLNLSKLLAETQKLRRQRGRGGACPATPGNASSQASAAPGA